jgi:hypothetical protein
MAHQDEGDFWGKAGKPKKEPAAGEGGGFWGKGGESPQPAQQPEEFWSKAESKKKQAQARAAAPADEQKRRRGRRRRVLLISLGSLVLLLILLVVLAPTIAGSFAPGLIEKQANAQITGTVRVKDASFGWLGPQRIEGLELRSKDGQVVAAASAEVDKGLFGFIRGNLDLGTVTLSGVKATVVKQPDGTTNLQDAVTPRQPAKPGPAKDAGEVRIPDSLRAHVVSRNMQITFIDTGAGGTTAAPTAVIRNADLDLKLGAGEPLKLKLDADAVSGQQTGKIEVAVSAEKLIRKDGLVQPDKATVDASAELVGFPLALADALAPLPQGASLRQGVGQTIDITIKAKGSLDDARAQLTAAADNLQASGDVKIAKGVLTTESPLQASIKGTAVRALAPQLEAAMREQGTATLDAYPDITISLTNLRLAVPASGALDLRGATGQLTLGLTETRGTVTMGEGRTEPFRIAPLEARVESAGVDQGARVTAATSATINNQPAGDVNVDLRLAGLLDDAGGPVKGLPGSIEGAITVRKIATAIAQPFLAATKIDLPRDIGPTLDVEVRATTETRGVAAGATPPTALSMAITSEGLRVNGGVQLSQTFIRTVGDGLRVEVLRPATIAAGFLDPQTGLRLAPSGEAGRGQGMVVTVKGLDVPRNAADGALQIERAQARVDVALSGIVVEQIDAAPRGPAAGQAAALALNNTTLGLDVDGGNAKLALDSAMAYGGQGFSAKANYDIRGLLVRRGEEFGVAPAAQLQPIGKLELRDAPTAIAAMFLKPAAPSGDEKPIDLPRLLADTLGPTLTGAVTTAAVESAPGTTSAVITLTTPTTIAEVNASLSQTQLSLRKLAAQMSVTPQTVTGLMHAFAPDVAGAPRLAGPARVIVQADPIVIPMRDFAPLLDRAGVAGGRISIPGRTLVDGLQVKNEDGTLRELGRVGVDTLEIAAKVPVAALLGPALPEERKATATLSGTVLGPQDEALVVLAGNLATEMSDGKLAGALAANAKLSNVNTRLLEQLAGKDGLISGAIGNTMSAQLTANLTPPRDAAKGFDFTQATTAVQLTLEAPRLRSDGPIQATVAPSGVTLDKPVKMVMDVEPAWVNKFFEKPLPPNVLAGQRPPPDMQLTRPTTATLTISKLTYPLGELDPARLVFMEAGLSIAVPQLQFVTKDGQDLRMSQIAVGVDATPVRASDAAASVMPKVPVNLRLDVAEATIGEQPASRAMAMRGSISDLVDARGNVSLDAASIAMTGDLPAIPSALVDALLKQEGLIEDALGPVASVRINVERYPLGQVVQGDGPPPVVSIQAESQRAKADVRGTIRDNTFVSERPMEVTIVELTQELAKRLIKGLPLMGTLTKSPQDAPALIVGSNLTVPMGNDMTKLNGSFRIDPGEARFDTSTGFARLLKGVGQRESGVVGRRLQPVNVRVVSGIATYEKWSLPVGEFEVQTEGTVDLVKRTMDVVTYVPFSELSESAAGVLNTSVRQVLGPTGGSIVNAATMVPIRTSGPLDNPTTGVDSRLFLENIRKNLRPGDVLGDLLRQQLQPK